MLQSKIRRGELDRLVTFIKPIKETGNANSDKITGWEAVDTDPQQYMKKVDISGQDVVVADRLTYAQRTKWIGDYRSDLTTENRIVHNTRVFEIIAITDSDSSRERYIEIMTNLIDTELWT